MNVELVMFDFDLYRGLAFYCLGIIWYIYIFKKVSFNSLSDEGSLNKYKRSAISVNC